MPKLTSSKKSFILLLLFTFLITAGAKCGSLPEGAIYQGQPKPVSLKYWKVFEESDNIGELIGNYKKANPYISIDYKTFTAEEYEDELLNALAEDRGPDIFSVHTTATRKYQTKITALPASLNLLTSIQVGTVKKETFTKQYTKRTLNLRDLKLLFPDVIYDNQVINNEIYGLPLSIDTLALFYNKDLLNNAGITSPPKNWQQFVEQVIRLTKKDQQSNIVQAGTALGTANNVARATDILSLLMMQSGTPMTDEYGNPTFSGKPRGYTEEEPPAANALNFYNSFASPTNEAYTWNEMMPNSREAFIAGLTAFYLGYAYDIPTIKTQAPKLHFEIAPIPQLGEPAVNFANYWIETVSKKSQHPNEAWDFILYVTTKAENNKTFITRAQKPIALRELIEWQKEDLVLSPFADQILTSRSWYKGKDPQAAERIFLQMISDNLLGIMFTRDIIGQAVSKIEYTYR